MRAFAGNSFDDYYAQGIHEWPLPARLFLRLVIYVVGALSKILAPWTIENPERLWEDKRSRVLVMNHVSAIDPVIVVVSAYMHGIYTRPIFKDEFNSNIFMTWLFSRVGGIPVKRNTADISAVRKARGALERGECVLVFPEGTRIRDDEPHEIHGGFALMAQLAGADVQPLAIVGARNIKPQGVLLPKPFCRVFVRVGECISYASLGEGKRKQLAEKMETRAWEEVCALKEQARADHPGKL